ncbi:methylenetetrahydrofolate--tRNA-(uracil(54)-C(5))-methyltransferase (FADH(2)-oxidizing) TrmFO [candidate division WOR-3 bacterium]|uniref:Methylenetetrahydrofolate--tRNA-(uracil-5-)-methyltransferase TrmFO n=1 Tax=candidate division WOR-3 bacterium TaxID=2052148 RepID=A0A9D5KAF1_UNCW3|nr:methylenetetrahydrofolate--tRNA-(uracil(54)-C(5))-methyltransferase (FADH(2)-oxidizing) TrmFO [candidate division WOR-3 bacterium]MBD3364525.1 methylenetetrahydrofolate--tRNA-(uracil(54)-C(5))-methyltransferase (FADH(2)-oxidizing) TrmFO [candidate division WOR-3 bacterium]
MNDTRSCITVVGGGLAGCEAALQIAKQGLKVKLYEMRPERTTPAHTTDKLAELICSNSLGSMRSTRALGLLKEELRMLGSVLLGIAEQHSIPAGTGLTVDRKVFATEVTGRIEENPQIELIRKEVAEIPEGITVLASGPLTSDALSESLGTFCGIEYLYFYDAVAPIISTDSLDMAKLIKAARYDSGEAGFLNSFMDKEQYLAFYEALITAERHELHDADADKFFFEGCLPVEEIAKRGERSLAFGPLRPVGFRDADGRRPYSVVQLRPEDRYHSMYNLVGFQTNLRNTEQERVFRLIPGLEKAEFLRYGRLHRNTYIEAPELIVPTLQFKKRKNLLVCGQLSGGEGYLSAIATGLVAGMNAFRLCKGLEPLILPLETMLGALLERMAGKGEFACMQSRYSPTKPILALLPRLDNPPRSKEARRQAYADRSFAKLTEFLTELN